MIHPLSDVQSKNIGKNTSIWQFCVVLAGAKIGTDYNICSQCFIENDVIGENALIAAGSVVKDVPANSVFIKVDKGSDKSNPLCGEQILLNF